jgi:hypothetical protein
MPSIDILEKGDAKTERDHFTAGLLISQADHASLSFDPNLSAAAVVTSLGGLVGATGAGLAVASSCIVTAVVANVAAEVGFGVVGAGVGCLTGAAASVVVAVAAPILGVAGAAVAGIGGGIMLGQALAHKRVIYIVVENPTDETFTLDDYERKEGNLTVPRVIPPHSMCGIVMHHSGPAIAGYLRYVSENNVLMIGASNPCVGKNKLRVELMHRNDKYAEHRSGRDLRDDTKKWLEKGGDVPVAYVADRYSNPSVAYVRLNCTDDQARQIRQHACEDFGAKIISHESFLPGVSGAPKPFSNYVVWHENDRIHQKELPQADGKYDPGKRGDIPKGKSWVTFDKDGWILNYWHKKYKYHELILEHNSNIGAPKVVQTKLSSNYVLWHEDDHIHQMDLPQADRSYDPGKKKDIPKGKSWITFDKDGDILNYWHKKYKYHEQILEHNSNMKKACG